MHLTSKTKIILGSLLALVVCTTLVATVMAQTTTTGRRPPENKEEFFQVIANIANYLFTGLIIFGIISIVIAGYYYLLSAGDPEMVKKAHRMIIYSCVAVGVGVLAQAIVRVVMSVFTVPG